MRAVEHKIKQAWLMTFVIGLPASVGLAILAQPLNIMMYKDDLGHNHACRTGLFSHF